MSSKDFLEIGIGELLGFATAVIIVALVVYKRYRALSSKNWSLIAGSDPLIAKMYSGYMGAGGDWESWKHNEEPGAESRKRFQFHQPTSAYRLIQRIRDESTVKSASGLQTGSNT